MNTRLAVLALATAALAACEPNPSVTGPAAALRAARDADVSAALSDPGAVYTLTNQVGGNAVAVFARGADGRLTAAETSASRCACSDVAGLVRLRLGSHAASAAAASARTARRVFMVLEPPENGERRDSLSRSNAVMRRSGRGSKCLLEASHSGLM